MTKKAVLLFNLGGPDSIKAIKHFLFNLFNDKCIINLPKPFRYLLAKYISYKRFKTAREIYSFLGGKSPILDETKKQANKLEKLLGQDYKVFISMRYWKPFIEDALKDIEKYNPDEVILLPLYPQYSTATTLSSFKSCITKIKYPTKIICCYYDHPDFIKSQAKLILKYYYQIEESNKIRILFSAHGLPYSFIEKGDPYEFQINKTATLISKEMKIENLDWRVCYQSKVGKKKWLEPSTESEIKQAVKDGVSLIIVPIAFVSEHSETLVELDIEYKNLAKGIKYFRVNTVSDDDTFINCLAKICIHGYSTSPCAKELCWKKKQCFT